MKQDARWGWFAVVATVYASALWHSEARCFSTFYQSLMIEYNVEYVKVSFLIGLFEIGYGISCCAVPILFKYVDYRPVIMGASVLSASAIFLAYFADSLWQVQASCGFVSGICMGGFIVGLYTSVAHYFMKYRVLAMQISNAGAALGGFAFCPLYQYLIDTYSWRGAWQLVAGVFLQLAVFGALVRPIAVQSEDSDEAQSTKRKQNKPLAQEMAIQIQPGHPDEEKCVRSPASVSTSNEWNRKRCNHLCKKWDLDLFVSFDFYLYIFAWVSVGAGFHNTLGYLVPFGKSVGFDSIKASALSSAFAIGEFISRVLQAFVFIKLPKKLQYPLVAGFLVLASAFYFCLPFAKSYSLVLFLCGLVGLCIGGIDAIFCVFLAELFALDKYASAYGFSNIFSHLFGMGVTVSMGHAIDHSGSVATTFWIGGGSLILAGGLVLLIDRRIKQKCLAKSI